MNLHNKSITDESESQETNFETAKRLIMALTKVMGQLTYSATKVFLYQLNQELHYVNPNTGKAKNGDRAGHGYRGERIGISTIQDYRAVAELGGHNMISKKVIRTRFGNRYWLNRNIESWTGFIMGDSSNVGDSSNIGDTTNMGDSSKDGVE